MNHKSALSLYIKYRIAGSYPTQDAQYSPLRANKMASSITHYAIFLASYLGVKIDHHAIYVNLNENMTKCGHLFHVVGTLQRGMSLELRENCDHPSHSATFKSMHLIGWVPHAKLDQVKAICETVPPPEKQWDGARRLVHADQIRHCQHWAAEVLDMLKQKGALEQPDVDKNIQS